MPTRFTPPAMSEGSVVAIGVLGNPTKLELLHALARSGRPMNSLELAAALDANKVSIHRNLVSLEEHGLITADLPRDQRAYQRVRVHWTINPKRVTALLDLLKSYALGIDS